MMVRLQSGKMSQQCSWMRATLLCSVAMATCSSLHTGLQIKGVIPHLSPRCRNSERLKSLDQHNPLKVSVSLQCSTYSFLGFMISSGTNPSSSVATILNQPVGMPSITPNLQSHVSEYSHTFSEYTRLLALADLDPETAKLAIGILGPLFSAFSFLFIVRIVMSWYPKLPVGKFPYIVAYAPTEPLLIPTRKLIPPLGGVDVTPVVWFALISFLNEILIGPQGLLILLSQHV